MAEPLTSSDIIRERMGFGVSPLAAPETRRAYAAAGLSPLGTQERERFERGGALSPMASTAEKEAWKMAEFQAGRREQAPIEYGGIGDRPVGESRRAIRMQEEWDKRREQQLQEMRMAQQMENEAKQMEALDLDMRIKEREFNIAREEDIFNKSQLDRTMAEEEQAFKVINSLRGQPNAYEAASEAIANLPYAASSERVQKSLWALGQSRDLEGAAKAAQAQKEDAEKQAQLRADIVTYGVTPEQQKEMLESNLPAGVVRFDPLKAAPVIAAAKKAQETIKETKAEEKETKKGMASKEDEYQKALAEYDGLVAEGETANPEDTAKAKAKTRAAAAVLGLPKVSSESDLRKYKSGQRVLAPDGITVITIP